MITDYDINLLENIDEEMTGYFEGELGYAD